MPLSALFEEYRQLKNSKVVICYMGAVSQAKTVDLGTLLRHRLEKNSRIGRLFSVFIEMSHNIRRHSLDRDSQQVGIGLFSVQRFPGYFALSSANPIGLKEKRSIKARIEELRKLDKQKLRALYNTRLRETGKFNHSVAKLGLIEMAKKSDSPLDYEFIECDSGRIYFRITAKVVDLVEPEQRGGQ